MNKPLRLLYLLLVMPFAVHAGTAGTSLVVCKEGQGTQIRILSVDGQTIQGESVRLTPGSYKLAVSCIKMESYGELSVDTVLVMTVKPDIVYELRAIFEGKNAKVSIRSQVVFHQQLITNNE